MRLVCLVMMVWMCPSAQEKFDPRKPPPPPGGRIEGPRGHIGWNLPISTAKNGSPELLAAADEWRKFLTPNSEVWAVDQNPGCALWITVDASWLPFADTQAYLLIVHPLSAVLRATSAEQVTKALADLRGKVVRIEDVQFVPVGVLTNLPVIK